MISKRLPNVSDACIKKVEAKQIKPHTEFTKVSSNKGINNLKSYIILTQS